MTERITYWRCRHCFGTGMVFEPYLKAPITCFRCDGSGNALIDGAAEQHKRRLAEFDRSQS
jgi:hypothetical protein